MHAFLNEKEIEALRTLCEGREDFVGNGSKVTRGLHSAGFSGGASSPLRLCKPAPRSCRRQQGQRLLGRCAHANRFRTDRENRQENFNSSRP
jgi:hypothetical protein